jgi:hypothetical protein
MERTKLEYIVNHVFLPPKLPPGSEDQKSMYEYDRTLCELVVEAAMEYSGGGQASDSVPLCNVPPRWAPIIRMIRDLAQFQPHPSTEALKQSLLDLNHGGKHLCLTIP